MVAIFRRVTGEVKQILRNYAVQMLRPVRLPIDSGFALTFVAPVAQAAGLCNRVRELRLFRRQLLTAEQK